MEGFFIREVFAILAACCAILEPMIHVFAMGVALLVVALLVGFMVVRLPLLRKLFLPTAVASGLLLLLLGPEIAGKYIPILSLPSEVYTVWSRMPPLLINVVFATLFLGKPLLKFTEMGKLAAPQVAFGQTIAWGQYMIGGIVALVIAIPVFGLPPVSASLLEISFEGGHGTVAGLSRVFQEFGFEQGKDIAVGLATASLISALAIGVVVINIGQRRGWFAHEDVAQLVRQKAYTAHILHEIRQQGVRVRQHITPWRLAHHGMLIVVSVFLGWLLHEWLLSIERATWGQGGVTIIGYLPIFPLCMFGGMIMQYAWRRLGLVISREIVALYSSLALMVLIATAIGTMSLEFLHTSAAAFVVFYLAGTTWLLLMLLLVARHIFPDHWFINAIISFGQGMGMTATGLLFAQMTDPKNRSGAVEGFGYKQLMFEPFMGGGLVTALSMPAIVLLGLPMFTALCAGISATWLVAGLWYAHTVRRSSAGRR